VASASLAVGLIDTDIPIDAERGHPDAVASVTAQQAAWGVWISAVSAMELIVGCRNALELSQLRRFLQSVSVIHLDPVISQTAVGRRGGGRKGGRSAGRRESRTWGSRPRLLQCRPLGGLLEPKPERG
jgi:predicted nucleic acid-binding protein